MSQHHLNLRLEILKKFITQSDFASAINEHESKVSQVLRGRRKLSKIDAEKWKQILNCPQALIKSVSDYT
jgi:plasmid maintenance system antidote protein VapI